jgi:hypothetical protein
MHKNKLQKGLLIREKMILLIQNYKFQLSCIMRFNFFLSNVILLYFFKQFTDFILKVRGIVSKINNKVLQLCIN